MFSCFRRTISQYINSVFIGINWSTASAMPWIRANWCVHSLGHNKFMTSSACQALKSNWFMNPDCVYFLLGNRKDILPKRQFLFQSILSVICKEIIMSLSTSCTIRQKRHYIHWKKGFCIHWHSSVETLPKITFSKYPVNKLS